MRNLAEGAIFAQIISFMAPILLGFALQRFYTLADTVMVGRYAGASALAAAGAASSIANLMIVICNGFTSGFSIVTGQLFGAGNFSRLKKSLSGAYFLSFAICAILVALGLALEGGLLAVTKIPPELSPLASDYLRIMIAGLFASMLYNLLANILRSVGDSVVPLVFLVVSAILNILLDYFFIKILGMGISGAAIATVIAQGISGLGCAAFCVFRRPLLAVSLRDFYFSDSEFSSLISHGISMALMFSVVSMGSVILQVGINSLGSNMIAGYTAGRKYIEFFMLFGAALSGTAAAFASQNFGAKKIARIWRGTIEMILTAWATSLVSLVAVFLFARELVTLITGAGVSSAIVFTGIFYMKYTIRFFFFLNVLVILRSVLQGMNRKAAPVLASVIELAAKIFAVVFLVPRYDFFGVCMTEPLIWVLGSIWVGTVFIVEMRKAFFKAAE